MPPDDVGVPPLRPSWTDAVQDDEVGVAQRRPMRRGTALPALGLALAAAAWLAPAAVAGNAHASAHSVTVPDAAEAWYSSLPINTCTSPVGCAPSLPAVSPFPAGTLHVGVVVGGEISRSYLQPDLSRLPAGAKATGGTMTLPVATSPTDGTLNATAAELLACLVTKPFAPDAAGSTQPPPGTDCLVSAVPQYDAAKTQLVINLAPFLTAWGHGRAEDGIALVPSPSRVQQTDAWQLTIEGRAATAGPYVQSTLAYTTPPASTSPSITDTAPPPGSVSVPAPPMPLPSAAAIPPSAPAPQVAPQSEPVVQAAAPVLSRHGFQYPLAFLLPLALLAGGMFFTRLFTRSAA